MNTIVKNVSELIQDQSTIPPGWGGKAVIHDDNMSYVVWNEVSREALIIDPMREDREAILSLTMNDLRGYRFLAIIDTHTHADHISSAAAWAEELKAPLIQHLLSPSKRVHLRVSLDTAIPTAAGPLWLLSTPGHTPDCISPIWGPFLFGGDTLLFGDTGRDDLPGALGWLDRALAVVRQTESDAATDLARIQSRRGRVLTELGRLSEARTAFEEARRLYSETLGLDHASAWQATAGLALLEHRRGNRPAAEPLFRSILASAGYPSPENRARRAEADLLYGLFLAESGHPAEARPVLEGALPLLAARPESASDHRRAERALAALPDNS